MILLVQNSDVSAYQKISNRVSKSRDPRPRTFPSSAFIYIQYMHGTCIFPIKYIYIYKITKVHRQHEGHLPLQTELFRDLPLNQFNPRGFKSGMEEAERKLERGGQAGKRNKFWITNSFGGKKKEHQEKMNRRLMVVSLERDRMLATIVQKEVGIQEGKVQLKGLAMAHTSLAALKNGMEWKLEMPKPVKRPRQTYTKVLGITQPI